MFVLYYIISFLIEWSIGGTSWISTQQIVGATSYRGLDKLRKTKIALLCGLIH